MTLRQVPPAHSPLTGTDVAAGGAALLGIAQRDPASIITRDLGARATLLVDSGTAALTLGIRAALARRPGAAVALPAFCCFDVATAADGADAPVVLYDIDPVTLGPDMRSLERALAGDIAAVVVAHLFGVPVDMGAVTVLARAAGAVVIEDAAQGAGGFLEQRPLGSLGTLSVLSFGRGKGITGGGGGALVALDDDGETMLSAMRGEPAPGRASFTEWGKLAAQWAFGRPALFAVPASIPMLSLGETIYRPPRPVSAISPVAAAVVTRTWPARVAEAEWRRTVAARLLDSAPPGFGRPALAAGAVPGWLRLPLLAPAASLVAARTPRARRLGIMPSYPQSLADLAGFAGRCRNASAAFDGARTLAARLITLPTHRQLSPSDLDQLAEWLHSPA